MRNKIEKIIKNDFFNRWDKGTGDKEEADLILSVFKKEVLKKLPKEINEKKHNKINKDEPDEHAKWWSKGWNNGYNSSLSQVKELIKNL